MFIEEKVGTRLYGPRPRKKFSRHILLALCALVLAVLAIALAEESKAASQTTTPPVQVGSSISGTLADAEDGSAISSVQAPFAYLSLRRWDPLTQDYTWVNGQSCWWAPTQGCADEKGNFVYNRWWDGAPLGAGIYLLRIEATTPAPGIGTEIPQKGPYFVEDRFIQIFSAKPVGLGVVYMETSPLAVLDHAVRTEQKNGKTVARWEVTLRNEGLEILNFGVATEVQTIGPLGYGVIALPIAAITLAPGQTEAVEQKWVVSPKVLPDKDLFIEVRIFRGTDHVDLLGRDFFEISLPQKAPWCHNNASNACP